MMQFYASGHHQHSSQNDNITDSTRVSSLGQSNDYQILIGRDERSSYSLGQSNSTEDRQNSLDQSCSSNTTNNTTACTSSHPNLNLLLYIISYIIFMVFGACLFTLMEQPLEIQMRDQLIRKHQAFVAKHQCIDADSLNSYIEFVLTAQANGVSLTQLNKILRENGHLTPSNPINLNPIKNDDTKHVIKDRDDREPNTIYLSPPESFTNVKNQTSKKPMALNERLNKGLTDDSNWDFSSSLLFVTTIVTTIGYGHITPLTNAGKIACILFTCVGIPATLTFLSTMVALLIKGPISRIESFMVKVLSGCCQRSLFLIRMIHLLFVTFFLITLCFVIPALVFSAIESNWTFLDAFYFCYISLTTIGLGDFVAGLSPSYAHDQTVLYRFGIVFYLYIGLTMVMLFLALIYRIPQFSLNKLLLSDKYHDDSDNERKKIINNSQSIEKDLKLNYGTSH